MPIEIIGRVQIPEEIFNQLKSLHYKDRKINDLLLERFTTELFEASIPVSVEYNDFKTKITQEFIPEEYRSEIYSWNADFYNGELVIIKN